MDDASAQYVITHYSFGTGRNKNTRKYSQSDVDVVWGCERSWWREPQMDQPLVQILVGVAKI